MEARQAVLISGSPRRRGNTACALDTAGAVLREAGYATTRIHLAGLGFSSCIGCEKCRVDKECTGLSDDLTPLYDDLLAAELWVLGSPVYNYNITSWMKAFIDRLYCFYDFEDTHPRAWSTRLGPMGKRGVTFVVAEQYGEEDLGCAPEALIRPLRALGVDLIGTFVFPGYFGPGALRRDTDRRAEFAEELRALVS